MKWNVDERAVIERMRVPVSKYDRAAAPRGIFYGLILGALFWIAVIVILGAAWFAALGVK